MLELDAYMVEGLRALLDTDWIPVRSPTILTGGNDGGKSTALFAIDFLLGGRPPAATDYTVIGAPAEDGAEPLRAERVIVTGRFSVGDDLQDEFELDEQVSIRRFVFFKGRTAYEIQLMVAADERLRDLEAKK